MDETKVLAAAKFIDWMTGHAELWAKAGHVPTRKSVVAKAEFKNLPYRKDYADAVKGVVAPPATAKWGQIYDVLSDLLEAAVAKNENSKDALRVMEEKVNAILK